MKKMIGPKKCKTRLLAEPGLGNSSKDQGDSSSEPPRAVATAEAVGQEWQEISPVLGGVAAETARRLLGGTTSLATRTD